MGVYSQKYFIMLVEILHMTLCHIFIFLTLSTTEKIRYTLHIESNYISKLERNWVVYFYIDRERDIILPMLFLYVFQNFSPLQILCMLKSETHPRYTE